MTNNDHDAECPTTDGKAGASERSPTRLRQSGTSGTQPLLRVIASNTIGTLVGGALLSVVFFVWSDFVYQVPDLNGRWMFETTVEKTSFLPYMGMRIYYEALLHQEGLVVRGSGEKVYEIAGDERREYIGADRSAITIDGYIDKNFFLKDTLVLHFVERGTKRESSTVVRLVRFDDSHMEGAFDSTAADTSGLSEWDRTKFDRVRSKSQPGAESSPSEQRRPSTG